MEIYLLALAAFVAGLITSRKHLLDLAAHAEKSFWLFAEAIGGLALFAAELVCLLVLSTFTLAILLILIPFAIIALAAALIAWAALLLCRWVMRWLFKKRKPNLISFNNTMMLNPILLLLLLLLSILLLLATLWLFLVIGSISGTSVLYALAAIASVLAALAMMLFGWLAALAAGILSALALLASMFLDEKSATPLPPSPQLPAAVIAVEQPATKMRVLVARTAVANDGCITMTRGTPLPLNQLACEGLSYEVGRDIVKKKGGITMAPVVMIGEGWYLVEYPGGSLGWNIPSQRDLDSVYKK
jgi:hypothetical protein